MTNPQLTTVLGAGQRWRFRRRGIITLLEVQAQDLQRAWEIAAQYNDPDFSLVDCATIDWMTR